MWACEEISENVIRVSPSKTDESGVVQWQTVVVELGCVCVWLCVDYRTLYGTWAGVQVKLKARNTFACIVY
jgi:hypothetical protein